MSKKEDSVRRPAKGPRIVLAQIAPTLGDVAANLERHRSAVKRAAADGADLIVFPELSLTGYNLKDLVSEVAITRGSDTWKELEEISKEVAMVVGLVEETPDHLFYNAAAYFEGGRCMAVHRKSYLPTYGMFEEQRYFARGRNIAAFDTKCGRVAMLVCEDMLHPSALTVAACDGATLIIVPSASPARGVTEEGEADSNARSWEGYLQVMARSFGVWVAFCNRSGVEDGVSFWGGSEVITPAGERALKGSYYEEDFLSAVMSGDAVRRRRIINPLVRDEDLDLTINELSRIRGRDTVKTAAAAPAPAPRPSRDSSRDSDGPSRDFDGPPRRPAPRSDREDRGPRDGEGPPRRFDRPAFQQREDRSGPPPRRFDRDDDRGPKPFRPSGGYQQRGGGPRFGGGDSDRPRFGGPPRGREDGPRFGGPSRGRDDGPPRGRDDGPPRGGGFGPPRGGGNFRPPREGGFGPPKSGGFGKPRDDRDAPRGRDDGPPRGGGFGPPRGGAGGFGAPRGGGFGPPRGGGFGGPPRGRDDGGGFGGKSSFGDGGGSRDRQRPEPSRKPFHKGAKPRGRGRKDD